MGTEPGSVLLCNRKAKTPADRVGASYSGTSLPDSGACLVATGARTHTIGLLPTSTATPVAHPLLVEVECQEIIGQTLAIASLFKTLSLVK